MQYPGLKERLRVKISKYLVNVVKHALHGFKAETGALRTGPDPGWHEHTIVAADAHDAPEEKEHIDPEPHSSLHLEAEVKRSFKMRKVEAK